MIMSDRFLNDVVAFGPHPDDVELCCGGTIAKLCAAGYKVGVVDLTQGELGSQGSIETRAEEARAASNVLGLSFRENLKLPDGGLQFSNEQVQIIVKTLRELRPEIVLVPYHQGRHPDHVAASELLTKASFLSGLKNYKTQDANEVFRPKQVLYYQMRYQFSPSILINISEFKEKKLEAINCYKSQVVRDSSHQNDPDAPLISSPLSVSSLQARDQYYGAMIGVKSAEPFFLRSPLAISDPIKFFRENPLEGSLFFPGLP